MTTPPSVNRRKETMSPAAEARMFTKVFAETARHQLFTVFDEVSDLRAAGASLRQMLQRAFGEPRERGFEPAKKPVYGKRPRMRAATE